jgi:adenylate cyclase
LPDEPSPGWALYVVGRLPSSLKASSNTWQEDQLKGDLKFTELVADVFGALRKVAHLERVESQLARFFSRPVRSVLLGQGNEEALAPRETDVTVLFCDLRGSCRIADDAPDDLGAVWDRISTALSIMTSSIIERDGVIGDFQGDAAMGFWGWPLPTPDQIERAARAALSIRKQFAELSARPNSPLAGFQCGIGIAHGRAFAGRLGTSDQAKVGVYGPRVNLASRLESLTKTFQTPILIDDQVAQGLGGVNASNWARVRRLAHVRPAGLRNSLLVSELMPAFEPGAMVDSLRRDYEAALDLFLAGRWPDARRLLGRLPDDGPTEFLIRYMNEHPKGPPEAWGGTVVLEAK